MTLISHFPFPGRSNSPSAFVFYRNEFFYSKPPADGRSRGRSPRDKLDDSPAAASSPDPVL